MGGRMYDPTISRFLSPDPHVTFVFKAQNYNRYAYVINNPLKYTDPTGYDAASAGDGGSDDDPDDWNPYSGEGGDDSSSSSSSNRTPKEYTQDTSITVSDTFKRSFASGLRTGTIPTVAIARLNIPYLSMIANYVTFATIGYANYLDPVTVKDVLTNEAMNQLTGNLPGGQTKDLAVDIANDFYSNNKKSIDKNINKGIDTLDNYIDEGFQELHNKGVFDVETWKRGLR